ncbi:NfeD family protein [Dialister micraerophilus]|uniref:NfeD family protein n=1 Tax=Dialister micraerophilus TaxID=309120 RepID=UPI0023F400C5|nr:NfeD family protein [Dialister micraerophilus]
MHKIQIFLLTVLLTSILFPMKILAFSGNDYIFMNNFIMEITLVSVIFISIFAEIKTAGFSGAGIVAIISGSILFFIHGSELLYMWDILLFFSGIILLFCDLLIFFTGAISMAGILCICMGLYINLGANLYAFYIVFAGFAFSIIVAYILLKRMSKSILWDKLSQKVILSSSKGYKSSSLDLNKYIGKQGITATVLRPTGKVKIDKVIFDAISDGDFIEVNKKITVININGSQVVVRLYNF